MTRARPLFIIAFVQKIITAEEMREIDRLTVERYATPSLLLMEAAAVAVARQIASHFSNDLRRKTALVLCGRGNNGGDGAAIARALWRAGARADVLLFGSVGETKGDTRVNFDAARRLASFEAGSKERPSLLSFVECDSVSAWEELASARRSYDVIVDALFGTGLKRPLEGIFRQVVEHLSLLRRARERAGEGVPFFVSVDVPSGLDADSAEPVGEAVSADLTVTFTAPKPANVLPPAAHFNGRLFVAQIGSPPSLIDAAPSRLFLAEADDARRWLARTRYAPDSYKNTHGHVLVVAGSRHMTGAAVLSANAAMRAGAGLVTVATPRSAAAAVAARLMPEVLTAALEETDEGALTFEAIEEVSKLAERADALAVGPGLTSADERTRRFVRALVEQRTKPLVIDADGLNSLAPWPDGLKGSKELPIIITPHAGEMRRLLGDDARRPDDAQTADESAMPEPHAQTSGERLRADRVGVVRGFAVAHQLHVVLKGTRVLVAAPDGRVFVNPTGNAGLGRAGSGDTLTGIVVAFNAQAFAALRADADALEATLAAVYVGGLAGDLAARERGMRTLTASDVREHVGAALRALDEQGELP
ncbi:MAG TPA: NAD(P)H-hydrate dehydratase [Pyrinomonadaceae bacterium]|nr:NAD(P)H-hydrate dehydratase [Pyrinomonadaceae bacterium]